MPSKRIPTTEWKVGDKVDIGMLKGLQVKAVERHGELLRFTLADVSTQKEYTFTPGGLRKTYEPPATVIPQSTHAIATLRKVLERRCRRGADAETREDLQSVIRILQQAFHAASEESSGGVEGTLSAAAF